jgi:hypothetical protein
LKIFNEEEQDIQPDEVRENVPILSILEIQGIRCSSRTFQLELEVKQLMVLKPDNLFDSCLFTKSVSVPKSSVSKPNVPIAPIPIENPTPVPTPVIIDTTHLSDSPLPIENGVHDVILEPSSPPPHSTTTTIETNKLNESNVVAEQKPESETKPLPSSSTEEIKSVSPSSIHPHPEYLGNSDLHSGMDEIDIHAPTNNDVITLKKRNYVYYKMYKEAKQKARIARDLAIASYLEAKKIRNSFLEEEDVSDEEDETLLEKELNEMKMKNENEWKK